MQPTLTGDLRWRAATDRNAVDLQPPGLVAAKIDPLPVSRPTRLDAVADLSICNPLHGAIAHRDSVEIGARIPGVEQNRAIVERPARVRRTTRAHARELNRMRAVRIRHPDLLQAAARRCEGDPAAVMRVRWCPSLIGRCGEPLWRSVSGRHMESPEVHLGGLARVNQGSVGGDAEGGGALAETCHSRRPAGIEVENPEAALCQVADGKDDSPVVEPCHRLDGNLASVTGAALPDGSSPSVNC
jgi:hypothetical protein